MQQANMVLAKDKESMEPESAEAAQEVDDNETAKKEHKDQLDANNANQTSPSQLSLGHVTEQLFLSLRKGDGKHGMFVNLSCPPTPRFSLPGILGPTAARFPACSKVVLIEFCCSPESHIGNVSLPNFEVFRCTMELDVTSKTGIEKILDVINRAPRVALFGAMPCVGGSSLQNFQMATPSGREVVRKHIEVFLRIWNSWEIIARAVHFRGGTISFEWPSNNRYWKFKQTKVFISRYRMKRQSFHGCAFGLSDEHGQPIKKPWTFATNCKHLMDAIQPFQCSGSHTHACCRGKTAKLSEAYTPRMAHVIASSIQEGEQLTQKHLRKLTVADLQDLCYSRFLISQGSKADLVNRLLASHGGRVHEILGEGTVSIPWCTRSLVKNERTRNTVRRTLAKRRTSGTREAAGEGVRKEHDEEESTKGTGRKEPREAQVDKVPQASLGFAGLHESEQEKHKEKIKQAQDDTKDRSEDAWRPHVTEVALPQAQLVTSSTAVVTSSGTSTG